MVSWETVPLSLTLGGLDVSRVWFRQDRAAVEAGLRSGRQPQMATTMASGSLDELVALHEELGILDSIGWLPADRGRRGIADSLLLRTVAVLPFLDEASLSGATELLFREPAILLRLGWAPVEISTGTNLRHRHPQGRRQESLPCHPDTLRDTLRRVATDVWQEAQRMGVQALLQRNLVHGHVYAIDGSGLGPNLRLVCLVCVSAQRPVIVAWRLLEGDASEKGREATVTRSLVEQAVELGGPGCIRLLLMDALYADGPLLAWLKYQKHIDALVPLPADREMYADLQGLARGGLLHWTRHSYLRVLQGHKQRRTIEMASQAGLTSWDSFVAAAREYGAHEPQLWGCLIRETAPTDQPLQEAWSLVSTRNWDSGWDAFQAFRPRWHIENDAYRELKEGWGLEAQRWGRDAQVAQGRVTLTCLAFNTAQIYRSRAGQRLAKMAIRRLRRQHRRELGAIATIIFLDDCYGIFPLEELLEILGHRVENTLRPHPPPASNIAS